MNTRKQHENTILQLRHQLSALQQSQPIATTTNNYGPSSVLAEKEMDRLTGVKVALERSCIELKGRRDTIATQIDDQVKEIRAGLEG
jgi:hypothetical protein